MLLNNISIFQASALWLMVLVKTCKQHPVVMEHLINIHSAFQTLLTEADGEAKLVKGLFMTHCYLSLLDFQSLL